MTNESRSSLPVHRLADPAYRRELLGKVEALISVLELARARVETRLQGKVEDAVHLRRVLVRLEGTLDVCHRARRMLLGAGDEMKSLPPAFRQILHSRMTYRDYLELRSFSEFCYFRELGPVTSGEIFDTDMDRLCELLVESEAA